MKLIDLILEIGDSTARPYKWKKWSENEYYSKYVFMTDSDISYKVTIENDNTTYGGKAIIVDFIADYDKLSQLNKDKSEKFMTNKGEQYRILSTVMEIVKDAIKSRNKGFFKKPVKYLVFTPMVRSGKDDWLDPMKNARTSLYLSFIKNDYPNATVENRNGMVVVTLNSKVTEDTVITEKQITYTRPNFDTEWNEAKRYPEFRSIGKQEWIRIANKGRTTNYSKIKDKLSNVDLDFKSLDKDKVKRFEQAFETGKIETPIAVRFEDGNYDLVAGNTRLSGLVNAGLDPKVWIVDAQFK